MEVEIELYGGLRERAGVRAFRAELSAGEPTVADVLAVVESRYPELSGKLGGVACAVDDEIVGPEFRLQEGATVALLPPVSGGSGRWLSPDPLDREALIEETSDDRCGALVVFSGDIRNHNAGRSDVVAIEYEAHEAIASRVLKEIEEEVLERFDVHQCRIQHRVGRVEVGQSSVLVVCRAAHRGAGFDGARYGIDELKERVPLWKNEHYADGESRFLEGRPLRAGES